MYQELKKKGKGYKVPKLAIRSQRPNVSAPKATESFNGKYTNSGKDFAIIDQHLQK